MTSATAGRSPLADWALDHLACGRELIERRAPEPQDRARLLRSLDDAARRIRDTRLRVAVVGEFSSGKSTLINALLGEALLPAGALPTTDTVTWVTAPQGPPGYAFRLDGSAHHVVPLDGRPPPAEVVSALCGTTPDTGPWADGAVLLRELTAPGPWSGRIDRLTVSRSAPLLDQGVVLIDTPGSNSPVSEHVRRTERVVADEADAVVVVVSSHSLVTDSLTRFLQGAVPTRVRDRCLFVVTRMDDLDGDDEHDVVLRAVRSRVERQLGIRDPVVLGAVPTAVTTVLAGRTLSAAAAHWHARFPHLARALSRFVTEQRATCVPARVLRSLDEALALVDDALVRRHRDLEAARTGPTARPVRDLNELLSPRAEPLREVTVKVAQAARAIHRDVLLACDTFLRDASVRLIRLVYSCGSRSELAERVWAAAVRVVEEAIAALSAEVAGAMARQANDAAALTVRLLDEAFTAEYADRLPAPPSWAGQAAHAIELPGTPLGGRGPGTSLSRSAVLGSLATNESLGKTAAYLLAGFPVVPSLDRLQEEVLTSLSTWLESVHAEVHVEARELADAAVAALERHISGLVEGFRAAHSDTVTQLQIHQAATHRRMAKEGAAITRGMATVCQRRLLVRAHLTRLDIPREIHE
ncbi:dynamin family protein [Streptomyces iakyrus]|uniref:dynamin family protein n=1 Tax=Streptomyces iakyrus TaxID=68219 RepID=UPI0036EEA9B1